MSTTNGLPIPTQTGMLGKNPNDSVVQGINANNETLMSLRKVSGGKRSKRNKRSKKNKKSKKNKTMKRRKIRGGGDVDGIKVPIVPTPYRSMNGDGQDLQSQQADMAKISLTSTANAEFDKNASQKGGKRSRKSRKSKKPRKVRK